MRTRYFNWTEPAIEMLKTYYESGLSWPVISGKISAAYDAVVSVESCRAAFRRYQEYTPTQPREEKELPGIFVNAPAWILSEIVEERQRHGFSRLYRAKSPERLDEPLKEHWDAYVDYVASVNDLTDEQISKAKAYGPTGWFSKWAIALIIGQPEDFEQESNKLEYVID